jgi:RimJ/RimL family protein N-acetyltransferase
MRYQVYPKEDPFIQCHKGFFNRPRKFLGGYRSQYYAVAIDEDIPLAYIGFNIDNGNEIWDINAWTRVPYRNQGHNRRLNEALIEYLQDTLGDYVFKDEPEMNSVKGERSRMHREKYREQRGTKNSVDP